MVPSSSNNSRILNAALAQREISADDAAALIPRGAQIGMSGFTGSGYPKAVPMALARRIADSHQHGLAFKVSVLTGASTGPELDGALAKVDGIEMRLPYQADPDLRKRINAGEVDYIDMHLGEVAQFVDYGFAGKMDLAIIETTAILEDGSVVPSSSVGNNSTWIERADKIILEVNSAMPAGLQGIHDIFYRLGRPPNRQIIPVVRPDQRIGVPYLKIPLEKVIGVVATNGPDRTTPFKAPDDASRRIAGHLIEFLEWEVKKGHLPPNLLPIQSGVGNIANAVLFGLQESRFEAMTGFTEVIQDGMFRLLEMGKMSSISATGFSLSPDGVANIMPKIGDYRDQIVMRQQEISNSPELIRRLGVIAMNAMIEADIYGNVNSTHIMGTSIQNGIGGSGDFARNGYLSIMMAPSTARHGDISTIVPMVSHVDHTEHDISVIVTDQGLADLRGLSPKKRAHLIIENCSHPDFRPALRDYFNRAKQFSVGKHTPVLLSEALSWHERYVLSGNMLSKQDSTETTCTAPLAEALP